MPEKIIRDPVHDIIAFRLEKPIDAMLFKLINAAEFQRLRRIRQLGMASLAYPGADHSRYSHSLGVMETARQMLGQLGRCVKIDEGDETACLAGALLHDLGHGPLSHVFERVSDVRHEIVTQRIIEDPESEVHQLLVEQDGALPGKVVGMLKGELGRTYLSDVLSSQLDADRFDYLLRDNLMTGSQYGGYDLRWLLHALTIDESGARLAVTTKGISAVEAYLQSRYHMYRNVYFHKVVRTAEGMLRLALQRAKRLAVQDRLPWPHRDEGTYKALLGQRMSIEEFTELDDVSLLHCLKLWTRAEDAVLAGLCRGVLHRKLFKAIELPAIATEAGISLAIEAAQKALIDAGGDAAYDLFYDEPADTPYEVFDGKTPATDIFVQDVRGQLQSFAPISPLTQALNKQLMFRRLHVAAGYREIVTKAIGQAI